MKRSRGRGRKSTNFNNRTLDSSGPDVKIRGSASHIFDKYQSLARDANSSGNRIDAENLLQHAEHYFRVMRALQANNAANAAAVANTNNELEATNSQSTNGAGAEQKSHDASTNGDASQEAPSKTPRRRSKGLRPAQSNGNGRKSSGGDKDEVSSDAAESAAEETSA
jgi:hypothetical protein